MNIEVLANPDAVAQKAAEFIAAEARTAVAARGRFVIAVSGGHTPWAMLRNLATEDVPWKQMHVVGWMSGLLPAAIPTGISLTCARVFSHTLRFPRKIFIPCLSVMNTDVALTGVYMSRRRMTLTYPILSLSRRILFLVTGKEKVGMLPKLLVADNSIPSGRIRQDNTVILADRDAADRAAAS